MANRSVRNAFGSHSNRVPVEEWRPAWRCTWHQCDEPQFDDLPLCLGHAMIASKRVHEYLDADSDFDVPEPPRWQPFVYYLMVSPTTVKIGYTINLTQRLLGLRTDAQYIVALEYGGRDVEKQRHLQFSDERRGKREDFLLSERLKRHIDALQPERDKMVELATTFPLPEVG